jgi:hypothetical protein
MAVDLGTPSRVSHIGPVILIKSRRILKRCPVDIENEAFLVFIDCQDFPGNGEELVAHSQNPSERKQRVCHAARRNVDHDFINLTPSPPVFFTESPARVLAESTRRYFRPGSVCLMLLAILDPPIASKLTSRGRGPQDRYCYGVDRSSLGIIIWKLRYKPDNSAAAPVLPRA